MNITQDYIDQLEEVKILYNIHNTIKGTEHPKIIS
jgi:hypothetical protein